MKNIFKDSLDSILWKFIKKSDIVTYYYSDYNTVEELLLLLLFLENIKDAYNMALPLTLSNKHT